MHWVLPQWKKRTRVKDGEEGLGVSLDPFAIAFLVRFSRPVDRRHSVTQLHHKLPTIIPDYEENQNKISSLGPL
jgi:hypothetical protein